MSAMYAGFYLRGYVDANFDIPRSRDISFLAKNHSQWMRFKLSQSGARSLYVSVYILMPDTFGKFGTGII